MLSRFRFWIAHLVLVSSLFIWTASPSFALRATGLEESKEQRGALQGALWSSDSDNEIIERDGLRYEKIVVAPDHPKQGSLDGVARKELGTVVPAPPGGSPGGPSVGPVIFQTNSGRGLLYIVVASPENPAVTQQILQVELREGIRGEIPVPLPPGSWLVVIAPAGVGKTPLQVESIGRVPAPTVPGQAAPSDKPRFLVAGQGASRAEDVGAPVNPAGTGTAAIAAAAAASLPPIEAVQPAPVTFLPQGRSLFSLFSQSQRPSELKAFFSQSPAPFSPAALRAAFIPGGSAAVAANPRIVSVREALTAIPRSGTEPALPAGLTSSNGIPLKKAVVELQALGAGGRFQAVEFPSVSGGGQGAAVPVFASPSAQPEGGVVSFPLTKTTAEQIIPAAQAAVRILERGRIARVDRYILSVQGVEGSQEVVATLVNPSFEEMERRLKQIGQFSAGGFEAGFVRVASNSQTESIEVTPVVEPASPAPAAETAGAPAVPPAIWRSGVPQTPVAFILGPRVAGLALLLPTEGVDFRIVVGSLEQYEEVRTLITLRPDFAGKIIAGFGDLDVKSAISSAHYELGRDAIEVEANLLDVENPNDPAERIVLRRKISAWLLHYDLEARDLGPKVLDRIIKASFVRRQV